MISSRMDVLKNLLFELDEICKENNLDYTLTDEVATSINENGNFPEEFDYLTVAMTSGDIERFEKIVNGNHSENRQVEYFLNNPKASGLQVRFCDCTTTLINVKEFGNHINYGMFIKIKPIEKVSEKKREAQILNFLKKAWRGSTKRIKSCSWKRFGQVVVLKTLVNIIGKKRAAILLYNYNRKLKFIDKWDDIDNFEKVQIGSAIFEEGQSWKLKEVEVNGKKMSIADVILDKKIEKTISHNTVLANDIENSAVPFERIINSSIVDELNKTQMARDEYLRTVTKANHATKVINKAWNIYLMTRDIVLFREIYSEDVILKIKKAVEDKNCAVYKEEMAPYLLAGRKWKCLKVPFLGNSELEAIIDSAKNVFD